MYEPEIQRPIPVEQAIHWKPLRDAHYIMASLQPADGGRRRIFVRQQLLAVMGRPGTPTHGRRVFGLLLGQLYHCPVTDARYLEIESLTEQSSVSDEDALAAAIEQALQRTGDGTSTRVLGWFHSVPRVEERPARGTAAIHFTYFTEPWQPVLLVSDNDATPGGAFFLHDAANARWFPPPFCELTNHIATGQQAKGTVIAWPQYITSELVVAVRPTPMPNVGADVDQHAKVPEANPPADSRPVDRRQETPATGGVSRPPGPPSIPAPVVSESSPPQASAIASHDSRGDRFGVDPADTPPSQPLAATRELRKDHPGKLDRQMADTPIKPDAPASGVGGAPEEPSLVRHVADTDDTTSGDNPDRFIALARAEGFRVAARFDSRGTRSGRTETLWVLDEPVSGILLTVVATDRGVLDANLHYNVHVDERELLWTPFPEHRDLASRTVYVKQTCTDSLRAMCRRLRLTQRLERDWKVSPTIHLLTPSEWRAAAGGQTESQGVAALRALNAQRTSKLPERVRRQIGLTPP